LVLRTDLPTERSTWALGQALVDYWAQPAGRLSEAQLQTSYQNYLS